MIEVLSKLRSQVGKHYADIVGYNEGRGMGFFNFLCKSNYFYKIHYCIFWFGIVRSTLMMKFLWIQQESKRGVNL